MQNKFSRQLISDIYNKPFISLIHEAQSVHKENHQSDTIQLSTLLSIKTGACPEDCNYCSQSAHFKTDLEKEKLIDVDKVITEAKDAKANGSTRFCMGAAWRNLSDKDLPQVKAMIKAVKDLEMESCVTLGMVSEHQANELKDAGLDYYNHNLDTSREYYNKVITTRTYDDRLNTIENVRNAGINVCCGGILGLGEDQNDRIGLLFELSNMDNSPESIPINQLVAIEGTPLADKGVEKVDSIEFVRTIATARILMPTSYLRLSAGRESMSDELQALCFIAGVNSIFTGEKLLTTENMGEDKDKALLEKLGIEVEKIVVDEYV